MKRKLVALLGVLFFSVEIGAAVRTPVSDASAGRMIVKWADGRVTIESASNYGAAALSNPDILYVEPDAEVSADITPNDPSFSDQWSLSNESAKSGFGGSDINVKRAWEITTGSDEVVIFFFDTGLGYEIPDIADNLIRDETGVLGFDFINNSSTPVPESTHGNHTASIATARGNDGSAIAGIAWNTKIVSVKFLDASNKGLISNAIRAYEFMETAMEELSAKNPRLRFIASNSWGGTADSQALLEAMMRVSERGALIVTSAGNHGKDVESVGYFPCQFPVIANICVGASDASDSIASFSGWSVKFVHLLAPGKDILGIAGSSNGVTTLESKSGTSQAVPHVSGVAALVWSVNRELSNSQVMHILLQSSDPVPGIQDRVLSAGRVNAYAAVSLAKSVDASNFSLPESYFENRRSALSNGGGCQAPAAGNPIGSVLLGLTLFLLLGIRTRTRIKTSFRSEKNERGTEKGPIEQ